MSLRVHFRGVVLGPSGFAAQGRELLALLERYNCRTVDLGIARDDPETIRQAIVRGLEQDVLLVSGGMSMGAHDYVPAILRQLFNHPLTEKGLAAFLADWAKTGQQIA